MLTGRQTLLCLVLATTAAQLRAQTLAPGRLLVTTPEVADPNFAETVVLLTSYSRNGATGLILNRPTNIPLSAALDGLEQAKGRNDPVYVGGPVGRRGAQALLRSRTPPAKATRVIEGLYLISSRAGLAEVLRPELTSDSLRLYMGYAGWSAGRLEAEVGLGMWHTLPPRLDAVFDPNPGSLWQRLSQVAQPKLARLQ